MGSKAPHRYEIIDREFPVRITVRADPATYELTRQWLQRHVGAHEYASKPQTMWSHHRAQCVYFRSLHAALMFLAGCPHIQLHWEKHPGPGR